MSAIKGAFEVNTDNPVGRAQLLRTLEKHNQLIQSTKAATDTKIGNHVTQYRKWRGSNPTWKPTDYEVYSRRATDFIMTRGIARAQSQTDSAVPRVPWKHRKARNEYRATKFDDPVYVNTGGYEVQWSQQEGVNARRYLDMHERATKTKCYVDSHVNPKCLGYKAYRDKQRAAVCAPIDVPIGPLHSTARKQTKRKSRSAKSKEGSTGPKPSAQSKAMLDQMASKVLQSAMGFASNERVRSKLVKAMENPNLNPLRSQGANPDRDSGNDGFKAMYQCDVITGFQARDKFELSVKEGTRVFVLEDNGEGFFLCMDENGGSGRVPAAFLHFTEAVPLSSMPSATYSLGRGSPIPACKGVSKGDFGKTGGRTDYSRAMTAPVKKKSSGLNLEL